MIRYIKLFMLTVVAVIAGCASSAKESVPLSQAPANTKYQIESITANKAQVPEHFIKSTKSYVKRELSKYDLLASNKSQANRFISIKIQSFRMRKGFNRQFFGVMAGKDGMASIVEVKDKSGKLVGKFKVDTFNVLAIGSEDDIPRMHAREIAKMLAKK
jgi:phage-related tail fiber protein